MRTGKEFWLAIIDNIVAAVIVEAQTDGTRHEIVCFLH